MRNLFLKLIQLSGVLILSAMGVVFTVGGLERLLFPESYIKHNALVEELSVENPTASPDGWAPYVRLSLSDYENPTVLQNEKWPVPEIDNGEEQTVRRRAQRYRRGQPFTIYCESDEIPSRRTCRLDDPDATSTKVGTIIGSIILTLIGLIALVGSLAMLWALRLSWRDGDDE